MPTPILQDLLACGAVAVLRLDHPDLALKAIDALRAGGVRAVEVTLTTPGALALVETLARREGTDLHIGVGSVLDEGAARRAIAAGAQFVVSPVFKPAIVDEARRHLCLAIPGAFTPTEIQQATEAGAEIIKVFPAEVLGMGFLRSVLAPMPHLRLMPTGGVTPANAGDWLRAGACVVGVGSALIDPHALAAGDFQRLTDNARCLCQSIAEARNTS
jgi:2-dehydro-3-deoxyphosphogluconate aldolase/(4S)-4-hydroxy-2-oxoglutarate aldolase